MPNLGLIEAKICRTPEVILDASYTYSTDIWEFTHSSEFWILGEVELLIPKQKLRDISERKTLFNDVDPEDEYQYDDATHLPYITAF